MFLDSPTGAGDRLPASKPKFKACNYIFKGQLVLCAFLNTTMIVMLFYPDGVVVINHTMPVLLPMDEWQVPISPSRVSKDISKLNRGGDVPMWVLPTPAPLRTIVSVLGLCAVMSVPGGEVTLGMPEPWQGAVRAAGLCGEARAVLQQTGLWLSVCTSPGHPVVP